MAEHQEQQHQNPNEQPQNSPTNPVPPKGKQAGNPGGVGSDPKEKAGGPGTKGVYPESAHNAPDDAEVQGMASFGQGKRGAEGYADHGGSEIDMQPGKTDQEVLNEQQSGKAQQKKSQRKPGQS
ncbi:MAG TPA: hypothetical protein VFI42_13870 [Thermomicrobiaceae bacterium]|nr:hypothetical protein [Thermomicrobiaceae bacterium]